MLFEFLIKAFLQERKQLLFSCLQKVDHSFLHFHFIFAVHIRFISYTINTHFFHRNIWTQNLPAPNVSGFIAQLVEHRTGIATSRVQTPLKSWIFFQASFRNCINCVHCDDHFFIFRRLIMWPTINQLQKAYSDSSWLSSLMILFFCYCSLPSVP